MRIWEYPIASTCTTHETAVLNETGFRSWSSKMVTWDPPEHPASVNTLNLQVDLRTERDREREQISKWK